MINCGYSNFLNKNIDLTPKNTNKISTDQNGHDDTIETKKNPLKK